MEWDEDGSSPSNLDAENIIDPQSLLEITAGLSMIDEESGTIRLAHFTTQEYLNKHRGIYSYSLSSNYFVPPEHPSNPQ